MRNKGPWLCFIEEDFFGLTISIGYAPKERSFQIAVHMGYMLLAIGYDF